MLRRSCTFWLSLVLLNLSWLAQANAQAVYGSLRGRVTDAQGGALAEVSVTVTRTETQTSETVQTDESGAYQVTRLLPGQYQLRFSAPKFKVAVAEALTVSVDTATEFNVALQPGQLTEEITVKDAAPLLKTDRADVATVFEPRQLTELPQLDRNFSRLILLTPGAQQLQWQQTAAENPQSSVQTMVNGQHFSGTGYQLDGTENRDPILGLIVINPNVEAIGEAKITAQNYDAEFGQAIAGVVTVSTKSGTNDMHGAAYLFRRSGALQARNPFTQFQRDPVSGTFLPPTLRNQFGGALGGPILKNRWFFFGDYEALRSKIGGSRLVSVPTAAARQGDLSGYGVNIFDPATTQTDANGNLIGRAAFTGNRIPANRLSPQALNLLKLIPLPNVANAPANGTLDNYLAAGSESFNRDSFDVRIDAPGSGRLGMFGRYSLADLRLDGPTAFGAAGGPELVSLGGRSQGRNQSLAFGLNYAWRPDLITDFRLGFFRYRVQVTAVDYGQNTAADAGVPGLNLDQFSSGLFAGYVIDPRRGQSGGFSLGSDALLRNSFNFGSGLFVNRCGCPLDQIENQWQLVSNTTWQRTTHLLKFGADVRRAYNWRVPSDLHRSGELIFDTGRTRGVSGGGLGLASFLLGDVTTFGRYINSRTDARERQWRHFYYGQDTWQATPRLTVNYGLRLEVINPQTVNQPGNGGFLDLETGAVRVAGVGTTRLNGNVENSLNWAGRLSLAYKVSDKLVLRLGYGRSYDIGVFGSLFGHTVTQNLPVLAVQRLNAPTNFERVFTLTQGPPAFTSFYGLDATPKQGGKPNASLPASGQFFLPDGVFARALPDKQRLPSVDAYNATVQYQLTPTLAVEAAYVGNKGTHVFAGDGPQFDVNQPTLNGFGTVPRQQRQPLFNKFGWTQQIDYFCNCADNRYDAAQFKLTRRFGNGSALLAHYTLQRAVQDAQDYFIHDATLNRGEADWNRRHSFVLSQLWELPFGRGQRWAANLPAGLNHLVGGWQINSNTTVQSGLPYSFCYDAGANIDTGPCRPNIIGEVNAKLVDGSYTYNTSAFGNPGVGRFGNQKRNSLTGPGYWRTDASLFKRLRLREQTELEFRVEAVNVFNHVNLGNPDSFIGGFDGQGKLQANPTLGRIFINAYFGADPMRNVQFAFRLKF